MLLNTRPNKTQPRRHSITGEGNRQRILSAAEEVFAAYGYNGGTVGMIAEQARLSKPNVLYYFPSKAEIYDRLLVSILDDWIGKMALFEQAGDEPADKIAAYIRGKIAFSRIRPNASRVFANEIIGGARNLEKAIHARLRPQLKKDVELVYCWIRDGKIDSIDPYHLFFLIWSSTQSYADFSAQIRMLLQKEQLETEDFKAAETFLINLVLKGLGLYAESGARTRG
ncbi:TetR/AcrR family transcriptional regulator [Salinisphaera sp.]|uniref:TetR/AcrR family transcriptional regulator n=1 Tax=Salinisphaera sp. TaxID=1914330 RepID=UPI002D779612|nr:TetR/AcrR family transcriptional regulator [Salinisphaera sp.]HET7313880.1 TetR/AcrR family transcriptional regulator [Salinisphaera sp.]